MFDYRQRAATDEYREGWERVYRRIDGSLHTDGAEFVKAMDQMELSGVKMSERQRVAYEDIRTNQAYGQTA